MRNDMMAIAMILAGTSYAIAAAPAPSPARPPAAAPTAAVVPADPTLPTMTQLKQQLSEGKHQEVLRQVTKLLQLKGEAAKPYDRYELFTLRGDASLRAKTPSPAAEAFAQAAKATDDPVNQSVARATELLIRRSKPLGYVPKAAPAAAAGGAVKVDAAAKPTVQQPLPIIEEGDRKIALNALLADEMAATEPKIRAATKAEGLQPIVDGIKSVGDLRAIEVAATGSSERTKALVGDLGDHAHRLISSTLATMKTRTEACWQMGSRRQERQYSDGSRERAYGMMGLTSVEQNDLKSIIATAEKVQPVAAELASVTDRAELIADAQDAKVLLARAIEVLKFDYPNAGRYTKPPQQPGAPR